MSGYVFGLDIGGTRLRAAIASADGGEMIDVRRLNTPSDRGPEASVDLIAGMLRELAAGQAIELTEVASLAAGIPGPTDPEKGILFNAPHLPYWSNVPFAQMLTDATGIPSHIRNDAQMAAYGEYRRGAGQGSRHLVYVTVSTGIGGGIVVDGSLYGGAAGTAGEVGHIVVVADGPLCSCGRHGCLEALSSGTAMARIAAERVKAGESSSLAQLNAPITSERVAVAASDGDALATSVLTTAGRHLGLGLGSLLNVLAPEVLVLGGGAIQAGPLLLDPMHSAIKEQTFQATLVHARIELAGLGQDAGLAGAIEWARTFLPST